MADELVCRLAGRNVARILDAGGIASIEYLPEVVEADAGRPLLSVRLPVRPESYAAAREARAFLEGVLPEGWVRQTLAERARLDPSNTFGLLERYGGDCAGAVSFHRPGQPSVPAEVRWLTEEQLAIAIRDLRALPLGDGTDTTVRLSLGGVQEKLVVVCDGEQVGIPVGDQPSTHILKPSPLANDGTEQYPGIAQLEHLCLSVARRAAAEQPDRVTGIGFAVAETDLWNVGGRTVLVVRRYDRRTSGSAVTRLHQEDGCQALGLLPGEKYQRRSGGEPSLASLAGVLHSWGEDPLLDQRALLQAVAFTVIAGNADLHARNISFLHDDGVRLAPLYDVVPTATYSNVDQELGLRIGSEYHLADVSLDALVHEAATWGLGQKAASAAVRVVCEAVGDLIPRLADEIAEGFDTSALRRAATEIQGRAAAIAA